MLTIDSTKGSCLKGTVVVPGDKSISQRALLFGALSKGTTTIYNFLLSKDTLATLNALEQFGVKIIRKKDTVIVYGKTLAQFQKPKKACISLENSGTGFRLLVGLLAGSSFSVMVTGDASLQKRPMARIVEPLKKMGADISGTYAPLKIKGTPLSNIQYTLPVASAQVKSALLLAGLHAKGTIHLIEKEKTRTHTEEMITQFGGNIHVSGKEITLKGPQELTGTTVYVPNDFSSAAFFIAAALLFPHSSICLKQVGIHESRIGFLHLVQKMGGKLYLKNKDIKNQCADIYVQSSSLKGIQVTPKEVVQSIDEMPLIALLATQALGKTVVCGAEELKVKETDRLNGVAEQLNQLKASITVTSDGWHIQGKTPLIGNAVDSLGDHRIAMMLYIAGHLASGTTQLTGEKAIAVSYPQFYQKFNQLFV